MTRRLTLHMISGMLTLAVVLAAVTGVRSFLKKRAENQNVGVCVKISCTNIISVAIGCSSSRHGIHVV